ncbi:NAD(P)/FAD-dependent oxidoreductase [Rhizorhabdus dicambivorans]|uniref:NADH:ubiquinone reductase (non-electrogenic) n=1 Tax=Rhizorhabdus dicambivorans TaxID=1850238 RepID=A0A2A4FW32_9SPHN|nr:NAD(P)/FAD-dependent oxidoreductase [Rhizorhabdus dicambivorans]ATE65561.1 NAD(P)/FAD-dependent oxidoreductase [Rhizorhabdus dicambivorans]PCE41904.1 NAD(P)/FAD-dependent oxidoreductase [Rhizorhabdus dicambivorans]
MAAPVPARPRPRVVIVGAGFAGLSAARELARHDVDIVLIDKQNHHLFQPLLYQVATAGLSPADIAQPIRSIVRRQPRTQVLLDSVDGVDKAARQVRLASGAALDYDALIVATGARHSYFGASWADRAPGIKTIDDAISVRRTILLALEKAETSRQEHLAERAEYLTFVVVGGGPTGVEMAGAIAELTRAAAEAEFPHITRHCVRIILVQSEQRLLPSFPPSLGAAAQRALEGLGVQVRLGSRVTAIDDDGVIIADQRIAASTVVWAAGVRASPAAGWLDAAADRAGRVIVGGDLAVPGDPHIFVIGDTAAVVDASGKPVPGIAPAAKQMGRHAARTALARLRGAAGPGAFRYRSFGNLATIGRKCAVVDFGWLRLSGLLAWLLWSAAHIYFLIGFRNRLIVCANWAWNYITFDRGARLITGIDRTM